MGMVIGLATIGDDNAALMLADPPLVWKVVAPEEPYLYVQAVAAANRPSLLARLIGSKPAPPPGPNFVLRPPEGLTTDLDKSWHGIHYLLTGTAEESDRPLTFLVSGGQTVGDIDVGYGPARAFTAEQTRAIHAALDAVTDDQLRARFDPTAMMRLEIYPEIWDRYPASPEPLDYLLEYVAILRSFLRQAVDGGLGLVVTLT
jgi:hypothetical protein